MPFWSSDQQCFSDSLFVAYFSGVWPCPQSNASVLKRLPSSMRMMDQCLRSDVVALSHVWLGLPGGRFLSDGGLWISVKMLKRNIDWLWEIVSVTDWWSVTYFTVCHCCCCCYLVIVLIVFLSFIVLYSEMWHIIGCWHCMATVISACRHLLTDVWHCHAWCGCCHCWWWCCQHLDWHRRLQTHGLSQPGVSQKIINVLSRCNFAHILATL